MASLPGFWMQILISLHGPHGHDRRPNYQSQPVVQCLLLWPYFSRIPSDLVIEFCPFERFAPCFGFSLTATSACPSTNWYVPPLSVRPPSARSRVACPAEIHNCRSVFGQPSHILSNRLILMIGLKIQKYCSTVKRASITQSNGFIGLHRVQGSNMARTTIND